MILTEGEAADLVAGKFYIAAVSKKEPHRVLEPISPRQPGHAARTSRRGELKSELLGAAQTEDSWR